MMKLPGPFVETIIIGGGFCGVNLALRLQELGKDYLILEKNSLFHAWKNYRWRAFQMNTPHGSNRLYSQQDDMPDEYVGRDYEQELKLWEELARSKMLAVREGCSVLAVEKSTGKNQGRFVITVRATADESSESSTTITCYNVVCCTGENALPKFPTVSDKIPKEIIQMHSRDFKGPEQFSDPRKYVMLVGSGQSGCQIADLLTRQGTKVLLATGKSGGCFRTYRGEDAFVWFKRIGILDMTNEARKALPQGEEMRYSKPPIIGSSKPISYFSLARLGVTVTGSLLDVRGGKVIFGQDRIENTMETVEGYEKMTGMVKGWASKQEEDGVSNFAPETDTGFPEPEWKQEADLLENNGLSEVPLDDIQGVVWCTGYHSSVSTYLKIPDALESDMNARTGSPDVMVSVSTPGLFYSGFPWIHSSSSAILYGICRDQTVLLEHMFHGKAIEHEGTTMSDTER